MESSATVRGVALPCPRFSPNSAVELTAKNAARQSRNEAGTTDRKIAGQKNGMPAYLSVPYFSVSRSSIRFPRSLRTISTIAVQRGQCRNRTARSVWSARSLLPLSNHPCLTTAPASWTHSKRFARQFIRRCLPPVPRSARSWFGRCFPRPGGTRSRSKPPRQRAIGPRTRRNDPPADGQHPAQEIGLQTRQKAPGKRS